MSKFTEWWEERDEAERVGLIFLASIGVSTVAGAAIGSAVTKGKFKKQLAKRDKMIADLQYTSWCNTPVSTTTRFIVEDPAMDELVRVLKDMKERR